MSNSLPNELVCLDPAQLSKVVGGKGAAGAAAQKDRATMPKVGSQNPAAADSKLDDVLRVGVNTARDLVDQFVKFSSGAGNLVKGPVLFAPGQAAIIAKAQEDSGAGTA